MCIKGKIKGISASFLQTHASDLPRFHAPISYEQQKMKQTDVKVNVQAQSTKTPGVPPWVWRGVSGRHGGVSPSPPMQAERGVPCRQSGVSPGRHSGVSHAGTAGCLQQAERGVSSRHGGVSPVGASADCARARPPRSPGESSSLCCLECEESFHYLTGRHVPQAPSEPLTAHLGSAARPEPDCWGGRGLLATPGSVLVPQSWGHANPA